MTRRRLDAELVRRGLARSREQAVQLVSEGRVTLEGLIARKAATLVHEDASIRITDAHTTEYVSRGGHKLRGALDVFEPQGLRVRNRRCLDAGASTGGFCDVLLRAHVAHIVAVDVGYGQLAWPIRQDERVTVLERTNVRSLTPELVDRPIELVVADLSFISLALVLEPLTAAMTEDGDLVVLVKPQFEVGRARLGSGGVVRDPALRAEAVRKIAGRARELGLGVRGVTASPLPGPAGNVEYFLWLQPGAPELIEGDLANAIERGPA